MRQTTSLVLVLAVLSGLLVPIQSHAAGKLYAVAYLAERLSLEPRTNEKGERKIQTETSMSIGHIVLEDGSDPGPIALAEAQRLLPGKDGWEGHKFLLHEIPKEHIDRICK